MDSRCRRVAVGYARVSSRQQARDGESLPAQRERIEAYARAHNLELLRVHVDDGRSGKNLDRPELTRALEALQANEAGMLVTCKLDRLTRSLRDLTAMMDGYFGPNASFVRPEPAGLVSIGEAIDTSTAAGRLMTNLLGTVAEWEREVIGERTAVVMQRLRAEGRYTGGHIPFGTRIGEGNVLEPDEDEQAWMQQMLEWRRDGKTYEEIGFMLRGHGVTPRGRSWGYSSVRRTLLLAERVGLQPARTAAS